MKEERIIKTKDETIKVIVQTPKAYQNRIVKYGWVATLKSRVSKEVEKFHKIAKRRFGPNRFGYSCDCEDNFYRGRICKHISAFKLVEGAK